MKINFTIITLLLTSILFQAFGQERVNRAKLTFLSSSQILTKATGWENNTTLGEWIDYENVISDSKDYKDKFKSLQGEYMMSKISQNFIKMQTKTISYQGSTYYVLMVDKWDGRYKYPSIKEDWYSYKKTVGFIFKEDEYLKLSNIDSLTELKTAYFVSMGSNYEKYDETKFLDLIQTEISTEKSSYTSDYIFPVMKSKEGNIRFYVPNYFSRFDNYNFEKKYFETDAVNFSNLIIK